MTTTTPARGTLYVVGTPIGNLDDLTFRAIACLRGCAVVACEDTRRTRAILERHGLKVRLASYHKFNEAARAGALLRVLAEGRDVALVTDGGTPGISDPGSLLVRQARDAGLRVAPVPGASALTALLSVCGFPSGPFTFIGFLPHRAGERRRRLEALRRETRPLLFFEAPHRLAAMLDDLLAVLGDREAFLGREMTKIHEEYLAGSVGSIRAAFQARPARGEIALLVGGAAEAADRSPGDATADSAATSPAAAVERLIAAGMDRREALRQVARRHGLSRSELYRQVEARKGRGAR